MSHRTLLIYNPTAGPWDMGRTLKRLATYLYRQDWNVDLVETAQPGDAKRFAHEAAQAGLDLVLVAGGDGTINEAVNGLVGTSTIMGLVPVGTGNILAHQLRMPILSAMAPLYVADVGDALLASRVQRVDTGILNDRYFLCWAGAGLDAEVAAQMEPRTRHTKRLGAIPYVIAGFTVATEFRGVRARINVEERAMNMRALLMLASNIQLYAAFFTIARHAQMDDGFLDFFVFKGLGTAYALRHLLRVFSGRYLRDPEVVQALVRQVRVETAPNVAVHLDGDPVGQTPFVISVEPASLRLLVPTQAPSTLFCKPPEMIP